MQELKDTLRSRVRLTFDGKVHKQYRGPHARERFLNEVRILRHLEEKGCPFVPQLLSADEDKLEIVTTSCGTRIDVLGEDKRRAIFDELRVYGVEHDDPDMRNVTYRASDGRFCVVDFEFATIHGQGGGLRQEDTAAGITHAK